MAASLIKADFNENAPTFFSILGVTYYLTLNVFEDTVRKISGISRPGNRLVFDFPDDTTFEDNNSERVRNLAKITAKLGEPMKHGFKISEITEALGRQKFIIKTHETPGKIQEHFFDNYDNKENRLKAFENMHIILAEKGDK
ncbi:MAG: hypothetical protein SPL99_05955 [Catonella sp.]|nr:hypothetical protein [Catonella sp.]MDY6356103.1 hypothetical protein [Catonella sp.]